MNQGHLLLLFVVIIAAISTNLVYLFSQSIRLDESQSIWVATKSVPVILKMNGQDVQTPLYSLLLHFWIQLFGSDIALVRLMSLLFYVLTIPLLYQVIRESSNRNTALLGVALFALSPFVLWYSQEARTYTLLTLLATLNHLFFIRFIKSDGDSGKLGYFVSSVLGIYSHYFFAFLLLAQGIYLVRNWILTKKLYPKMQQ